MKSFLVMISKRCSFWVYNLYYLVVEDDTLDDTELVVETLKLQQKIIIITAVLNNTRPSRVFSQQPKVFLVDDRHL